MAAAVSLQKDIRRIRVAFSFTFLLNAGEDTGNKLKSSFIKEETTVFFFLIVKLQKLCWSFSLISLLDMN